MNPKRPTRIAVAFSFIALMLCIAVTPGYAAGSDFEAGVAEYNQRHFGQAIRLFQSALKTQPKNCTAALYLANSYYQLRQNASAIQYYQWIKAAAPNSREAATANDMLSRLQVSPAASTSSAKATSASGSGESRSTAASYGSNNIEVVVVSALGDHPKCTPEFIRKCKNAISTFPSNVVALAARNNCKIYLTPTMIDLHPELQNTTPRTYEQGHTYKNCPALFESPNVVVCEYALQGENDDTWKPTGDPIGSLRHEFGHAVDAFSGYVTNTEEFRHTYEMERTQVKDPETRNILSYYVQEGRDRELGTSETFAEGCCILFGGSTAAWEVKEQTAFKQSFPNVLKLIKKRLDNIE
jgi:tetratricopeptide (TPR) repeat protein